MPDVCNNNNNNNNCNKAFIETRCMEIYSNLADVVVHKTYGTYIFNNDTHTTFTKK